MLIRVAVPAFEQFQGGSFPTTDRNSKLRFRRRVLPLAVPTTISGLQCDDIGLLFSIGMSPVERNLGMWPRRPTFRTRSLSAMMLWVFAYIGRDLFPTFYPGSKILVAVLAHPVKIDSRRHHFPAFFAACSTHVPRFIRSCCTSVVLPLKSVFTERSNMGRNHAS